MFNQLPTSINEFNAWTWEQMAPYFADLHERPLTADTVHQWLADWTQLSELLFERMARLRVATTQDTNDKAAEAAMNQFLDKIFPNVEKMQNGILNRLLNSGIEPDGMAIPIRNLRADAALFSEKTSPLSANK